MIRLAAAVLVLGACIWAVRPGIADTATPIVHGSAAVAAEIVAADRAFSARSIAAGSAKAFRDFMDDKDGLSFDGGEPKRGSGAIYQSHGGDAPPHSVLTWEPAEVFAASGGDMGVTWGHWVMKPNDPAKKTSTGHYVTVWRKNASGEWKGVVDIGDAD